MFSPIYTYSCGNLFFWGFFAFIDAVFPFHFRFQEVLNAKKQEEWDPMRYFSLTGILYLCQKVITRVYQMQNHIFLCGGKTIFKHNVFAAIQKRREVR